ncbi:MAG: metallophosphoesterase [Treponema sp.]|nr:metallophosphoesterase [Treponema sp.]
MKILCISDQIDPLVYSPHIKERFADVDLILSAGDLPMDYLDFIISNLNKPLFFVFGNHHTNELRHYRRGWDDPFITDDKEFLGCGAVYLGTKIKTEGKFILAGLGGSMRYNNGANQFTEFQMFIEVTKLIPGLFWNRIFHGRFLDILLTHAPPHSIHDKKDKCHWGFKTYLWFIKVFKPKYLVHGHIHLYDLSDVRCTKWENTTVVNAYSHYIIDFGD